MAPPDPKYSLSIEEFVKKHTATLGISPSVLSALEKREELESMAFPKGFSPHRHHPGTGARPLTTAEGLQVGQPCPHCGKALVKNESVYSEYVQCPDNSSLFLDPTPGVDLFWRFKRPTGPRSTAAGAPAWKKVASAPTAGAPKPTRLGIPPLTIHPAGGSFITLLEEAEKMRELAEYEKQLKEKKADQPKNSKGFPYARFRKLVDAVQAACTQGKIGSGFSLRRELMAARLWASFRTQTTQENALHLAFALVASERATDDERPFYQELWRAQMGGDLYPLPQLEAPKDGATWHPQAGLALATINSGVPLWLAGEAGAGKTYLTRQIAKLCGLDYVRLQGSRDRTVDDVIGAWGYDPAIGSVFRAGVVVETARNGGLLHIDEVSALPHEVTFELHAVLEGEPLTVLKNSGERVELSKTFRMVANDNSVGEGEQAAYVGLHSTNLAFRDRWAFMRVEPMPAKLREKLILEAAGVAE